MDTQIEAVFENGVLRPLQPLSLAEHERVLLTVSSIEEDDREATIAAIREGLEDVKAGRTVSYDEFEQRFRNEHGTPHRS